MKTKHLLIGLGVSLFIGTSVFYSCKDSDNPATQVPIASTIVEESQATTLNDDVDNEINFYVKTLDNGNYNPNSKKTIFSENGICSATVTVDYPDLTTWPKVITLDFGTAGCTGRRGNTLKGVLKLTLSGKFTTAGSSHNVEFLNFSINGNTIKGTKKVTYNGLNANEKAYWTVEVNDTITHENGTVTTWKSTRTRTFVNDNGTALILYDDVYSISGSSEGKNAKNETYSVSVDASTPLVVGGLCPYIKSGKVTYTSGLYTLTVDYGDGTCDPLATATVAGVSVPITLNR